MVNHLLSAQFGAPDLIIVALILIVIGVPIIVAFALNLRFQRRNPGKKPYKWGYYFSIACLIGGIGAAADLGIDPEIGFVPAIVCGAIYTCLAWFFAHRHHWAWITLMLFGFKPIPWF